MADSTTEHTYTVLFEPAEEGGVDLVDQLCELNAPTCDIDQMLTEIDVGRG